MNPDNKESNTNPSQRQYEYDEISLIQIYLIVKKNRKLFFSVILLSFFISLVILYFKHQPKEDGVSLDGPTSEYVLTIEIGRILGNKNYYIDQPKNTLEKLKTIYIPSLNQSTITAEHIKNTDLIILKVIETSDKVDYKKTLLTLAELVIKDHGSSLSLNNKSSIKVTRIIQQPTKRTIENKNKILIPVLGIILGLFLGFFTVFINEFMKKVKEAESSTEIT